MCLVFLRISFGGRVKFAYVFLSLPQSSAAADGVADDLYARQDFGKGPMPVLGVVFRL